jgi:peptidoglycan/LPS O-acetylase OafA/YrhL
MAVLKKLPRLTPDVGRVGKCFTQEQMNATTDRLPFVDMLRAIAALLVLIFHYEGLLQFVAPSDWPAVSEQRLWFGLLGVELFFVISGAVILLTVERTKSTWQFVVSRVARLYPAYWASVALCGVYLLSTSDIAIPGVVLNLTMLQKFFGVAGINSAYWTLAYELSFYVAIGACHAAGLIDRLDKLVLVWLACAFGLRFLGIDLAGSRISLILMPQFGHLFIAGMMVYRVVSGRATPCTLVALSLCMVYSLFGRTDWAQVSRVPYFVANASFIFAIWFAMSYRGSFPRMSWLIRLGQCSYSLYLFHIPVGIMAIALMDAMEQPRLLGVGLAAPVSLAVALLARQYIEVPGQEMIRRLLGSAHSVKGPKAELTT